MYLNYFGLREFPFAATPDPNYLFESAAMYRALSLLRSGLGHGSDGIINITGEAGVGKTLLCRNLLIQMESSCAVAYLINPSFTLEGIYGTIADELGVPTAPGEEGHRTLQRLLTHIVALREQGKRCIVLIDEAQNLDMTMLEALRLLTNLETTREKMLGIVLFGRPEINHRLMLPDAEPLRQRILFACALSGMTATETSAYIPYRIWRAGYQGPPLFHPYAIHMIHQLSRGIPRIVNTLCHKALLSSYHARASHVSREHVLESVATSMDGMVQADGTCPVIANQTLLSRFTSFSGVHYPAMPGNTLPAATPEPRRGLFNWWRGQKKLRGMAGHLPNLTQSA